MPTIVFASSKGGAGKTTSALVLATQLAKATRVTVIDADPNRPIKSWASSENSPKNLIVIADANEENIVDCIQEAAAATPFVVVDLEGTASKTAAWAISQADLVLIPTQGSQLDAEQANRAINLVKGAEKAAQRLSPAARIPYAVLLTRTNSAIRARTLAHIQKLLLEAGIPVLQTELNEREAFRAMFSFKLTLENLNPSEVANIDKAIANAEALTQEVVEILRKGHVLPTDNLRTKKVA